MADRQNDSNRELSPELQAFEARLALLLPNVGRLQRDRLLFEAGMAAAREEVAESARPLSRWVWPGISLVTTAAAGFLLAIVLMDSNAPVVERPSPAGGGSAGTINVSRQPTEQRGPKVEADGREWNSSGGLLVSYLLGDSQAQRGTRSTYFEQREMLLVLGGDPLPNLKETTSARRGRSNTRVSYADLLGELTSESQGSASGDHFSVPLKPLHQGTDL